MRIRRSTGDLMVLAGPPGGVGTVALLLVVGVALSGGGGVFCWLAWTEGQWGPGLATGFVALFGLGILSFGVGSALSRDRLELDRVTATGRWTRTLFGRALTPPIEFAFADVSRVQLSAFVDAAPGGRGGGGGASVEKLRARLILRRPRKRIDLDEAELQRARRVHAIAGAVAAFVATEIEDRTGR